MMEIEKITDKISQLRKQKGFTYENMADELELTTAAYRKIETGETKLSVERLFRISNILGTPINVFLGLDDISQYQNTYQHTNAYQQQIEKIYQENKELATELIRAKDQLIEVLQKKIEYLKKNKNLE